jgi:hypothetical protein
MISKLVYSKWIKRKVSLSETVQGEMETSISVAG